MVTSFREFRMIIPNFHYHKTTFTVKNHKQCEKITFSCRCGYVKQTQRRSFCAPLVLQEKIGDTVIYRHFASSLLTDRCWSPYLSESQCHRFASLGVLKILHVLAASTKSNMKTDIKRKILRNLFNAVDSFSRAMCQRL